MDKYKEALNELENWRAIDEWLFDREEEEPLIVNYPPQEFTHPMEKVPQMVKEYKQCEVCGGCGIDIPNINYPENITCVSCGGEGRILIVERPMSKKELEALDLEE